MAVLTPVEHLARLKDLEGEATNWRSIWDELQNYVTPWRDPAETSRSPGERQTGRIFDSTAGHVSTIATAAVHGLTMPSGTRWFQVAHPDRAISELIEVGQWLEDTTIRILDTFNASNLAQESQEFVNDLLVHGTGCLYMELKPPQGEGIPEIRFRAMPPGSYVVGENADGLVDTIYRKFKLSVAAMVQRWGMEAMSKEVRDLVDEGKLDTKMTIVHGVVPRDLDQVQVTNSDAVPNRNRPFEVIWMDLGRVGGNTVGGTMTSSVVQDKPHVLKSEGLHEFPFLVARWRKMSGEVYGRSPGIDALPYIRTLNQAVEFRLKAWALAIGPPIATSDRGVIGDVRLIPFGRTTVRGDPRQAIVPLDIGANFDVANFSEEQLRDQIRRAFFIDQLERAESQGLSPKSATEVSLSFEMMMRVLGPVASRLQTEFLAPLIQNAFRMLQRRDALIPAPDDLLATGGRISVRYQGPLARAESIQEVDAVNRWLQVTLPLAELHPEVLLWMDFGKLGRAMADAVSVPREVLRTEVEVAQIQAQQAAETQAAGQRQGALNAAEVINKVSPLVTALPNGVGA